jgi:multiple sugar transport system permease protein
VIARPTRILFVVLRVVLALAYLLPLVWIVITSLKSSSQVLQDPNALIFTPTLST